MPLLGMLIWMPSFDPFPMGAGRSLLLRPFLVSGKAHADEAARVSSQGHDRKPGRRTPGQRHGADEPPGHVDQSIDILQIGPC